MTVDDICSFEIENDEFERKSEKIDTDNIIETKHCEISENTVMEMERVNLKEEKKFEEGGYGWLICVGAFIIYIIIGGVMRCYSLIFDALLDKFQHSNAKTAWVGAIHSSLKLLTGKIFNAIYRKLTKEYYCRSIGRGITRVFESKANDFYWMFIMVPWISFNWFINISGAVYSSFWDT